MTNTHFTAWLVNDTSALDQDNCDVTVLQDEAISYTETDDGTETPVWASQGDQQYYGITATPAKDGDINDAIRQAEVLLSGAGWATVGAWEAVDNAYTITVERDA